MGSGPQLLTGIEAVAYGALAAGCRFFAGYPITPSSEIAETLAVMLPKYGGTFMQMEAEIAAMSAVVGASLAGVKSLTATSGPGFSLKQEAIGYACITETPCVVVNVQRGGTSTGLPTLPAQADMMQARWGTHGDHSIIALVPERVIEAFELTVRAFELSERFRTPVLVMLDEIVGHVTEKVRLPSPETVSTWSSRTTDLPPDQYRPFKFECDDAPPFVGMGKGYRYHVTGLIHDETGFPTNNSAKASDAIRWLVDKIEKHESEIADFEVDGVADADVLLFAYGATARTAKAVMHQARAAGRKVGPFLPNTIWPFPA